VPLYRVGDELHQEDQACNGLRLWAENFDHVTVMMPVITGTPPPAWQPVSSIGTNLERINIIPLPEAYRPDRFFRELRRVRPIIREEISKADYLSFSIGGLFGDWGSVSCWEAHKMRRPYAVWTDRVESEVVRRTAKSGPWKRRLQARLYHRPMAWLERFLIRRSALGLFHGKETFETYAPFCPEPHVVHDIHINKSEHIPAPALAKKISDTNSGPLKIGYVGRADAMKGPLDWIEALAKLKTAKIDFEAFWMGGGPYVEQMQTAIEHADLNGNVELLGFVRDRNKVLEKYREAQIFLFCHKTPESPRCLIEALISGTPIVGYKGAFASDLISESGGGRLVPIDDVSTLADTVIELAKDREALAGLIDAAVEDGAPFDDESVFHHRSDVIRQYL